MIDVVIVNYLSAGLAAGAAASALASAGGLPLTVWVVDNSADAAEAARLRALLDPRCRLIVSPRNGGFGDACNQVYDQTSGDWLMLLNPDARLHPEALARMVGYLEAEPAAGAVGPLTYWDSQGAYALPPSLPQMPWITWLTTPRGPLHLRIAWWFSLRWRARAIAYWHARGAIDQPLLSGGAALLRRSAVARAGGLFDPRFFLYYEDTDLFLRLRRAGYRLAMLPDALALHQFDACGRDNLGWKREKMRESRDRYMEKHHPGWLSRLLLDWPRRRGGEVRLPPFEAMGAFRAPPAFEVPVEAREGWLLEWSPSPFFIPAIGHFGSGEWAGFSDEVWRAMAPGTYFTRLAAAEGAYRAGRVMQWTKVA